MAKEGKQIPKGLASAIGACAFQHEISECDDPYDCAIIVIHLACGKGYETGLCRKRSTAERRVERWVEKHLATCPKVKQAEAGLEKSNEGDEGEKSD